METFTLFLQLLLPLGFPWLALWISKRFSGVKWLSPVLLCYAAGLLIGLLHLFPLREGWVGSVRDGAILLGIPLLLVGTDLRALRGQARPVLVAFGVCILCGVFSCLLFGWIGAVWVPESWKVSGMLVGLYTGGTPNLNAIGMALRVPEATILYLNGADIVLGGLFLLFLLSFAQGVYGWFLPNKKEQLHPGDSTEFHSPPPTLRSFLIGSALTLVIVGSSVGLTYLLTGSIESISVLLVLLTTLSIAASFFPTLRNLPGTRQMGDYCLLVFCVALGMLADFGQLASEGSQAFAFTGLVFGSTVLLQLLVGALFRMDRDTLLVTATAALYGPVFVPQVTGAIRAPHLLFGGIATGLLGYAVGNYLGLGVAYFLQWALH